jgi:two-component system cell cycle sensor histidine kinase/response regulator CckA
LMEVKRAGERAAALTRQLLAFSRKQVLQPVSLSLNEITRGLEKMLRRILGEDIELIPALAPDLGSVKADAGQMEQVLMNLLVNARDAMPRGGKITIETSNVELDAEWTQQHPPLLPGGYVRLTVTDTGSGIDKTLQERIFEPFFTTKERGKGTGLGLSMVYGIVTQSGGQVVVDSQVGRGSSFTIYLPRQLAAQPATPERRPVTRPARGSETILVVEDEEALLKVAVRALTGAGYTVIPASSGDEALLACSQHEGPLDLIATDVVMPKMSGATLVAELYKIRPELKVLYMSGYTDDAILHHGVSDAGPPLLSKPFTAARLTQKVREVLDGESSSPHSKRLQ